MRVLRANHLAVDVDSVDEDLADRAPVAIDVDHLDVRLLLPNASADSAALAFVPYG